MSRQNTISRRHFLATGAAVTGALAFPAVWSSCAHAGPDLQPVPDQELALIDAALPASAPAKTRKTRRMLVFYRCEGFVHGAINRGNAALERMGKKTGAWESVVSNEMSMFDAAALKDFDAVMFNNTTALKFEDESQRKALMDFVKGGKGVCGIHAATDNFYNWPEAAAMMGGLFDGHPWGGGGTWAVQIEEPDHPLNKPFDGKGFWIRDEIYKMRAPYSRENLRILLGLDMTKKENVPGREDQDNAIAWVRKFEGGRVFYCSLGHNNEIFWNPAVLAHYLAGIQFALGDLDADATPSAQLTKRPAVCPAPDKA